MPSPVEARGRVRRWGGCFVFFRFPEICGRASRPWNRAGNQRPWGRGAPGPPESHPASFQGARSAGRLRLLDSWDVCVAAPSRHQIGRCLKSAIQAGGGGLMAAKGITRVGRSAWACDLWLSRSPSCSFLDGFSIGVQWTRVLEDAGCGIRWSDMASSLPAGGRGARRGGAAWGGSGT